MRPSDFATLYRSTIGFDRLVQLLDAAAGHDADVAYPPYNIERTGENAYRITMAIAGFGQDELSIEARETLLTIKGEKKAETGERTFLHRGIAQRSFERRFQLADHVEVVGADLRDGLLNIELQRNLPERMRPRTVPIGTGIKQIEAAA